MAQHVWSILCRKAIVDKETNSLTLFEVVDALAVSGKPPKEGTGINYPMELVSLWMRDDSDTPETVDCRAELTTPRGKTVTSTESTLVLTAMQRTRWTLRFSGIPFHGAGTYWIGIQLKGADGEWRTEARVPLPVVVDLASAEDGEEAG